MDELLNLDLYLLATGGTAGGTPDEGSLRVRVESPAGEALGALRLRSSREELDRLVAQILPVDPDREQGPVWRGDQRRSAAERLGEELFEAVFHDEMLARLRSSLDRARDRGTALRIRLRLQDAPRLAALPWELLRDPLRGRFLASEMPVVRYLDQSHPLRPLRVDLPLRLLVAVASPPGVPRLDIEREHQRIESALGSLLSRGLVEVGWLPHATPEALREHFRSGACDRDGWHVLHFIGHGTFDRDEEEGELLLEREGGGSLPLSGEKLGMLLGKSKTLRLVVINACQGARASSGDPYSGVGQELLREGIPAVVAMQHAITDGAATRFAPAFYGGLVATGAVDLAITSARRKLYMGLNPVDWSLAVLYLRAADGRLFELPAAEQALEAALDDTERDFGPAMPRPLLAPGGLSEDRADGEDAGPAPPAPGRRARALRWAWLALPLLILAAIYGLEELGIDLIPEYPPPPLFDPACSATVAGIEILMQRVEPGSFIMGSDAKPEERPPHSATIDRPYCIGTTEGTQQLWNAVMGGDGSRFSKQGDRLPAEGVSWLQVVNEFLPRLNALLPEAEPPFRLLSEKEWEYAARGGEKARKSPYFFGDDPLELSRYGNCDNQITQDQLDGTAEVASLRPNQLELYDMLGNVAEWVADEYRPYEPGSGGAGTAAPSDGTEDAEPVDPADAQRIAERVLRGGSYENAPENCRPSSRSSAAEDSRRKSWGFRLARDAPPRRP